jgi:hypothetical protein
MYILPLEVIKLCVNDIQTRITMRAVCKDFTSVTVTIKAVDESIHAYVDEFLLLKWSRGKIAVALSYTLYPYPWSPLGVEFSEASLRNLNSLDIENARGYFEGPFIRFWRAVMEG